ncbi:MAG: hypothetical protein Q4G51_15545 [Dermatophilus congolensis]|nr:hypothetical protein [Dermatophilus congolensis]
MRRPKVDLSGCTVFLLKAEPKANRLTGEVQRDANGVEKSTADVYISDEAAGESGMVRITVPGTAVLEIPQGTLVRLIGCRVMHWDTNGRSGLAWSAEAVEPATQRPERSAA